VPGALRFFHGRAVTPFFFGAVAKGLAKGLLLRAHERWPERGHGGSPGSLSTVPDHIHRSQVGTWARLGSLLVYCWDQGDRGVNIIASSRPDARHDQVSWCVSVEWFNVHPHLGMVRTTLGGCRPRRVSHHAKREGPQSPSRRRQGARTDASEERDTLSRRSDADAVCVCACSEDSGPPLRFHCLSPGSSEPHVSSLHFGFEGGVMPAPSSFP